VAVKIKLKRMGKIHVPQYRIVVADSRTKRDGRAIEELGIYQPMEDPSLIRIDSDRVQYWLGVGAQPTEPVQAILKVTGDWQRFKGLPGAEGTLRTAEPRTDKKTVFEAAVKDASAEPKSEATTPRTRAKKTAAKTAAAAEGPAAEATAPAAEATAPAAEATAPAAAATAPAAAAAEPVAEAEAAPATADAGAAEAGATSAEASSEG
jgi:small subunit ribosomal protein S16